MLIKKQIADNNLYLFLLELDHTTMYFARLDQNVLSSELNNLDVDPHLLRWIAAFFNK